VYRIERKKKAKPKKENEREREGMFVYLYFIKKKGRRPCYNSKPSPVLTHQSNEKDGGREREREHNEAHI